MAAAEAAAAEKMKKAMEKKMEEMREKHTKELADAAEGYRQQIEEYRRQAANKLSNREEALRLQVRVLTAVLARRWRSVGKFSGRYHCQP